MAGAHDCFFTSVMGSEINWRNVILVRAMTID